MRPVYFQVGALVFQLVGIVVIFRQMLWYQRYARSWSGAYWEVLDQMILWQDKKAAHDVLNKYFDEQFNPTKTNKQLNQEMKRRLTTRRGK